ncbi:hypothetical protein AB3538_01685 [Acinetobacter baumannii]
MQKGNGRFYPDFICKLPNGKILVVEYKGADKWEAAKDDRQIGSYGLIYQKDNVNLL